MKPIQLFVSLPHAQGPPGEQFWAIPRPDIGKDLYEVNNVLWFTDDFSYGDIVKAQNGEVTAVVRRLNETVRLRYESSDDEGELQAVYLAIRDYLKSRELVCEGFGPGILALSVPIDMPDEEVLALLEGAPARWVE